MNRQDYETLILIRDKGDLIYTNQQMDKHPYGKSYNETSPQHILDDVQTINNILSKYSKDFREFTSFTENNRIRYQYAWSPQFTGVGYTDMDDFKNKVYNYPWRKPNE